MMEYFYVTLVVNLLTELVIPFITVIYFYLLLTLINDIVARICICLITQQFKFVISKKSNISLQSFFYVTDNAAYRNLLFYYRKSVWKKIHKLGLQGIDIFFLPMHNVDEHVKELDIWSLKGELG